MEKIVDRVKDVLLVPKDTWVVIKSEQDSQVDVIKKYLIYLGSSIK